MDSSEQIVKLNVGGVKYVTTKSSLFSKGENFLTLLISNNDEQKMLTSHDDEGFIFIDRDGELFRYVLNYLRTGRYFKPTNITDEEVDLEFDFYQVKRLNFSSSNPNPNDSPQLQLDIKNFTSILENWRKEATEWFEKYKELILQEISLAAQNGDTSVTLPFNRSRGTTCYCSNCGNIQLPTRFVRADLWQESLVDLAQRYLHTRLTFRSYNTTVLGYSFDFVFSWTGRKTEMDQKELMTEVYQLLNSWNIKPSQRRMVDSGCSVVRINCNNAN